MCQFWCKNPILLPWPWSIHSESGDQSSLSNSESSLYSQSSRSEPVVQSASLSTSLSLHHFLCLGQAYFLKVTTLHSISGQQITPRSTHRLLTFPAAINWFLLLDAKPRACLHLLVLPRRLPTVRTEVLRQSLYPSLLSIFRIFLPQVGRGRQFDFWVFLLPLVHLNKVQRIPREQTILAAHVCKDERVGGIETPFV